MSTDILTSVLESGLSQLDVQFDEGGQAVQHLDRPPEHLGFGTLRITSSLDSNTHHVNVEGRLGGESVP